LGAGFGKTAYAGFASSREKMKVRSFLAVLTIVAVLTMLTGCQGTAPVSGKEDVNTAVSSVSETEEKEDSAD
jgi:hypothetical protein